MNNVKIFLEEIQMIDTEKFKILIQLRELVFSIFPESNERIMYGGIMFSLENDYGGLFLRKNHISLEFTQGVFFKDPNKILEGNGKLRRHLKIRTINDITDKKVVFYIKQAL